MQYPRIVLARVSGQHVVLGEGTYGITLSGFVQFDKDSGLTPAAIKLSKSGDRQESSLEDEYDVLKHLTSDYVPEVYVATAAEGLDVPRLPPRTDLLAMELLGRPLSRAFDKLADPEARELALCLVGDRLFRALDFLARRGIIHRDLKPENLLLPLDGNLEGFKLADFGFSCSEQRVLDTLKASEKLDPDCSFVGSTRYASLIVHMGHPPSYASDFESGLFVLFWLFHGSLPWQKNKLKECNSYLDKGAFESIRSEESLFSGVKRAFPYETRVGYLKKRVSSKQLIQGQWLPPQERRVLSSEFGTLSETVKLRIQESSELWNQKKRPCFEKPNYQDARVLLKRVKDRILARRKQRELKNIGLAKAH